MENFTNTFDPVNVLLFISILYLISYPIVVLPSLKLDFLDALVFEVPSEIKRNRKKLTIQANIAYGISLLIVLALSEPTRSWREEHAPYLTSTKTERAAQQSSIEADMRQVEKLPPK